MENKRIIFIMCVVSTVFLGCNSSLKEAKDENKSFVGQHAIVDDNINKDDAKTNGTSQHEQDNNEQPRNYMPQRDYKMDNGKISFTRDGGKTWIDSKIKSDSLVETMESFRGNNIFGRRGYYISAEQNGVIAYLFGKTPTISISKDDGNTWSSHEFTEEFPRDVTHRAVGFVNDKFGYVALGTDWTMGTGQGMYLYITKDGGKSWQRKDIKGASESHTFRDIFFINEKEGVICFNTDVNNSQCEYHYTKDGGNSWSQMDIPVKEGSTGDTCYNNINYIKKERDKYKISLGYGNDVCKSLVFESNSISGPWEFTTTEETIIHYIG